MVSFAFQPKIVMPRVKTIARYGLSVSDWVAILDAQGNVCAICGGLPASGRFCIDHFHVKNWKKMSSQQRKRYVRGITCYTCNHYLLSKNMTLPKARAVVEYLEKYEETHKTLFS